MDLDKLNFMGALLAIFIISACILIFLVRLSNFPKIEYWLGLVMLLSIIPIGYLLYTAGTMDRPTIYYIQVGAILLFLFVEMMVDYIFKIEFRQAQFLTIPYVMIFFAGTGGLIGIASLAGRGWMISAGILFLIMAFLAFFQRAKTGM